MKKATLFITLTLLISWGILAIYYVLGYKLNVIVGALYMLIPMFIALFLQKLVYQEAIKSPLKINFKINRWFLIAWLISPILVFMTLGINTLFPEVNLSLEITGMYDRFAYMMSDEQLETAINSMKELPVHPIYVLLMQGLLTGLTINAFFGFGEELGWRGFLLQEFSNLNFWKTSMIIGFVWGLWHAPLILQGHNYPDHPILGVFIMIAWCMLLTPLFNYITIKANSVIAAAIMHGTLNSTAGISIVFVAGGNDLMVGMTGLPGFITLFCANFLLYLYDSKIAKQKIIN